MSEKIVLIDGHSILNRAFYGIPDLTNGEGLHTNAVYGFLNILFKILDEEQPQYLMVAFDVHAPTFRHKLYEAYKGTRKPMAEELRQQVPLIKEMLCAMGIKIVEQEGLEADDVIGTLAKKIEAQGRDVVIVSGDRDLLQLATDQIKVRIPKTKRTGTEIEDYNTKEVVERYQVTPLQFIDVKALMGDTADNIPGVPGIGEKTATNLIVSYGSIENAYAHLEEIKPNRAREMLREHYDMAQMSKELATIRIDAEIPYKLSEAKLGDMYTPEAYLMCKRLEFKQLLRRFEPGANATKNEVEENFRIITEQAAADALFQRAAAEQLVGVQLILEERSLLGMAVSVSETDNALLPVQEKLTGTYLTTQLSALLEQGVELAVYDLKPQLAFLPRTAPEQIRDVKLAAYLLNPLKNEYPYEDLAKDYLGLMVPSQEDLLGKQSLTVALEQAQEAMKNLCCYQAYVNRQLRDVLINMLREQDMLSLYQDIEMPLIYTLYDMELEGIGIDAEALKEYGENLTGSIAELEQEIYREAGEEFNINSPKQLGVILFDKLGMPNGKKTKTGYSTAAEVLEKLAPDYPIVSKILEYRQLAKLKSTYADGLAAYIEEDGRIRTSFQQTITATGRLSSAEPNLQNIPIRMEQGRMIRKVFFPKEGYRFVDADYSQIELRLLAHMSGDRNLIDAYRQAQDIHAITASKVFHVPLEEVTPLMRRNAKAVNFGIVYGISSFGLSQDLSITKKEADAYIKNYFETYPGIQVFLERQVEEGKRLGYAVTLYGRRRPLPELTSGNFMQRSFGERVAMNAPIQGTAADIIKIAMIRVHDRLQEEGLKSRLILQVHDELLVEAAEEEVERVCVILEEEMKHAAELSVTLEIDMHTGTNWYEAK